jgi:polyisoprenyl-phosphate glycosyltransferase
MYSLIIPIYKNIESLPELLNVLTDLNSKLNNKLEVIFVIDGSPDSSYLFLKTNLIEMNFTSKLITLSRNFGSFSAIKAGLSKGSGKYFAVMAADLQEPIELILEFFNILETSEYDITVGARESRDDPFWTKANSEVFWYLYKKFIQAEIPKGGVDIFGCNGKVRKEIISMKEVESSLIGLLFWVGFKRKEVMYKRMNRKYGKSGWTFSKKINYFMNSIFSFSDKPIKLLFLIGFIIVTFSISFTFIVVLLKFFGKITVPGYSATIMVISFFAGLNSMGLGLIGSYVWRAFENTKGRPEFIIDQEFKFSKETEYE